MTKSLINARQEGQAIAATADGHLVAVTRIENGMEAETYHFEPIDAIALAVRLIEVASFLQNGATV